MKKTHIQISLESEGKQKDFLVPAGVTLQRLKLLLAEAFNKKSYGMPVNWHLQVKGKEIAKENDQILSELGIADGDILQVVVDE